MNCYKLNEATQNKIESILESRKNEKSYSEKTYFKSLYSPGTLINDWYERRIKQKKEITSEPITSEVMDSYRQLCQSQIPDRRDLFNKIFEGYGLGQKLLIDHQGLAYTDNYVTTYDLMYNHLTKGICGPFPRRYYKGEYKPEPDLTRVYGNLTQWGLKEKVYEKIKKAADHGFSLPTTEMSSEYVAYDTNEVKKLNDFPRFGKIKAVY